MKAMSRKTFLLNEIQRILDTDKRSMKFFADADNARADELIAALMVETNKFYLNSSNKALAKISDYAYKYSINIETEFHKMIKRHFDMFSNYQRKNERKIELTNKINSIENLNAISKELNLNYGNVYRFFIKKEVGALKHGTAQDVIIKMMELKQKENNNGK